MRDGKTPSKKIVQLLVDSLQFGVEKKEIVNVSIPIQRNVADVKNDVTWNVEIRAWNNQLQMDLID